MNFLFRPELYFDAAASTPLDSRVKQVMLEHMDLQANNNSKHIQGFMAQKTIDDSLKIIANVLGVSKDQLCVTYSGTDSNRRLMNHWQQLLGPLAVWASAVEHSSVADEIPETQRFDPVDFSGLTAGVKAVALMGANSETGRVYSPKNLKNNYPEMLVLQDVAQSFAKYQRPDFDFVDAVSFAPQKWYGPKGIGLLWLKNPEMAPEISKDTHTKNAWLVAGMAESFKIWNEEKDFVSDRLKKWEDMIRIFITSEIPDIKFQEADSPRILGHINVAFRGVRGGELMTILSQKEQLCVSTGTACTSDIMAPTKVISYIEKDETWRYPIRIGLHKFLTDEAVQDFCEILAHYVAELRK